VWSFVLNGTNTAVVGYKKNGSFLRNYPNPFSQSTTISYAIQKPNYVTLKVYDKTGRELQTLVNRKQNAGKYSVKFDAQNLSQGIYFYRLRAGNEFMETKKMVLMNE